MSRYMSAIAEIKQSSSKDFVQFKLTEFSAKHNTRPELFKVLSDMNCLEPSQADPKGKVPRNRFQWKGKNTVDPQFVRNVMEVISAIRKAQNEGYQKKIAEAKGEQIIPKKKEVTTVGTIFTYKQLVFLKELKFDKPMRVSVGQVNIEEVAFLRFGKGENKLIVTFFSPIGEQHTLTASIYLPTNKSLAFNEEKGHFEIELVTN